MALISGWRLLTSSLKVTGSPTLLIKHEMPQHNGVVSKMKVYITDLTYLWTETIDRREIGRKAYEYECPIEPSLQMDLILYYLDKGLKSGQKTSLTLRSEKGRSHLVLHLMCILERTDDTPKDQEPMHWDFNLWKASEMDFTRAFVLPLIGNLFDYQSAVSDLKGVIGDKDKAIHRIETELKTHNKEIIGLFDRRFFGEHAPEKHKRSILMNKLPGFKPFDSEKWQDARTDQSLPKHRDLHKHVFEHGLIEKVTSDSLSEVAWWEDLSHAVEVEEPSQISQPTLLQRASTSAFGSSQIQHAARGGGPGYPVRLRSSSPEEFGPRTINENDEDSDATASTISDLESSVPNPPSRGMGRIGGRRSSDDNNNSRSIARSSDREVRPETRMTDVEANEGRPRGGLGKIGGLRRPHGASEDPAADLSQSGNMPARPTSKPVGEDVDRPAKDPAAATETEDQRADRRREMLKHDMEEKKKAPAKKKRKF